MRWPRWKIDVEVRVRPNRVIHQFHKWVFGNLRPGRETESAATLENASRFCAGTRWICEVQQREVRDDAIKAGIGKGKILRISLTKFDPRELFLRDRNHFLGKIETDRNCAAFRGSGGHITWTATDIQDRHLPGNVRGSSNGGMNWRVELDQVESYLFATRSQPACSNSVKASFIMKVSRMKYEC